MLYNETFKRVPAKISRKKKAIGEIHLWPNYATSRYRSVLKVEADSVLSNRKIRDGEKKR